MQMEFMPWCFCPDWNPIKREELINYDLEKYPLELKTKIDTGGTYFVDVEFYSSDGLPAGGFYMKISSSSQVHWITLCKSSSTKFESNLPTDPNKVWRITLIKNTAIRIQIHCNDFMVLDFLLSDSTI